MAEQDVRPKDIPKLEKYEPTRFMLPTSHYDAEKADKAVKFIEMLRHTKGKWAGERFWLFPWQEQAIRDIFGVVDENGKRQFRTAYIEIPKKNGKQLALDTPIPTPDGFTTMGNLMVGDTVFDEKGEPCHVVAKSPIDDTEQAYKLTFKDGSSIVAGARHLWDCEYIYGKRKSVEWNSETIYQKTMAYRRKHGDQKSVIRIPVCQKFKPEDTAPDYHYLLDIQPVPYQVKMQCIQVDSPSHLYLAGRSMVPTHNSELAAAVALYLLYADGEASPEVYGAAADRQQASIVFDVSKQMVDMAPSLMKRSKIMSAGKRIVNYRNSGFYQVLSAEVGTKHGLNVSGLVFDELHTQPNRQLYDVLTKGSGDAREQPLYFLITTAGTDRESICYEVHTKAVDILAGRRIDHTFYPVVYGLSDDDDWTDENNWRKANPSLGQTIQIERVRDMFQEAVDNPAEENVFKQLRLNMWVSSLTRFIPEQIYDLGNIPIDMESLKGRDCYGGLDLSSTGDITAFVLMFPPRNEAEKYIMLPFFWIPEDTIPLRVRRSSVPYDVWQKQGFINATEGNVIHYGFIEKFIEELGQKYHICEIAFDRWGATQMVQDLEDMGFTVVPFGQGFKDMSPPTKEFYKLLMEGRIIHGGHPVMRWMAGNVVVDQDPAGNIKCNKAKSAEKIDGIVAAIMALDRCIRHEQQGSVYDDPDHNLVVF